MKKKHLNQKSLKTKSIHWMKSCLKFFLILTIISIAVDYWRSKDIPQKSISTLAMNSIQGDWIDIENISYEKPVLLYFWATWCPVCDFVSPSVDWLSDDYQVVSIAITSGNDQRLTDFMRYKGYDFPVINDVTGNISQRLGITATPSIFIVKNGEISSITTGATTPIGLWLRLLLA